MRNERLCELFSIPADIGAARDDSKMLEYVITLIKDADAFLARVNYLY